MYIHTFVVNLNTYDKMFINCPEYSKVVNIAIRSGQLYITVTSESYVNLYNGYDSITKTFNIKVLLGIQQNNTHIEKGYKFYNLLRTEINDIIEYYYVFVEEIKTVAELRDGKIDEIMNQEF